MDFYLMKTIQGKSHYLTKNWEYLDELSTDTLIFDDEDTAMLIAQKHDAMVMTSSDFNLIPV